jgi:hypothetical protein
MMRAPCPHEHASTPRRSPYPQAQSPLTAHSQEEWTSLRPYFYHETAAWPSSDSDTGPPAGASQPAWRWAEVPMMDLIPHRPWRLLGVGDGRCIAGGDGCFAGGEVDGAGGGPGGTHDSRRHGRRAPTWSRWRLWRRRRQARALGVVRGPRGAAGGSESSESPRLWLGGRRPGAGACKWPGPGLSTAVDDSDDSDGPAGREWAESGSRRPCPAFRIGCHDSPLQVSSGLPSPPPFNAVTVAVGYDACLSDRRLSLVLRTR